MAALECPSIVRVRTGGARSFAPVLPGVCRDGQSRPKRMSRRSAAHAALTRMTPLRGVRAAVLDRGNHKRVEGVEFTARSHPGLLLVDRMQHAVEAAPVRRGDCAHGVSKVEELGLRLPDRRVVASALQVSVAINRMALVARLKHAASRRQHSHAKCNGSRRYPQSLHGGDHSDLSCGPSWIGNFYVQSPATPQRPRGPHAPTRPHTTRRKMP
jgi:hypothetical protein